MTNTTHREAISPNPVDKSGVVQDGEELRQLDIWGVLADNLRLLIFGPLVVGLAALGITYLITPTFTAVTTFLPPQQAQSSAASALASLGALGGIAAGAVSVKSPADQYVSLMQSVTVSDRIIERFNLLDVYDAKLRIDAYKTLAANVRISLGKKDGIISVAVDDTSPQRAANIANRYVDELRYMTGVLAVSEAQQRRVFFEQQLKQSREQLVLAQQALQASEFGSGALKAEPKAAAEAYAKLKAEATAAEVRLQTLRDSLTDTSPEVRQQQAAVAAIRGQLARTGQASESNGGPDYISKFREFKYQEAMFEIYARQFELARLDESREGGLIQVVDAALPPERKSRPRRAATAVVTTAATFVALFIAIMAMRARRGSATNSARV